MTRQITQWELRNDTQAIMRAVEGGETVVLTRNGTPIADIVPHHERPVFVPTGTLIDLLAGIPREDPETFFADLDAVVDPDPFRGPGEPERR